MDKFDKFYKALQKHRSRLITFPNVCGLGIGLKHRNMHRTDIPALIVFVEKKEKRGNLSRADIVPKKVSGFETDVIEIGKVRLLDTRQERHRPAYPGISIGHHKISAGTFGAVVKDEETGNSLILSNNHILANGTNGHDGRAKIGDPILQPGPYDSILKKPKKVLWTIYDFVSAGIYYGGGVLGASFSKGWACNNISR